MEGTLGGWGQTGGAGIDRRDLLDDVIARGAAVTVWLIQNVGSAKRCVLAALFDKGERE